MGWGYLGRLQSPWRICDIRLFLQNPKSEPRGCFVREPPAPRSHVKLERARLEAHLPGAEQPWSQSSRAKGGKWARA